MWKTVRPAIITIAPETLTTVFGLMDRLETYDRLRRGAQRKAQADEQAQRRSRSKRKPRADHFLPAIENDEAIDERFRIPHLH
jgi:hypothetical protein